MGGSAFFFLEIDAFAVPGLTPDVFKLSYTHI